MRFPGPRIAKHYFPVTGQAARVQPGRQSGAGWYPLEIYTHIHPYRGGPQHLVNCSGAGDAALAAVLHDVSANRYHRATVPDSEKHLPGVAFLTYSSLSRNAQYGNRVAYEVLRGNSPRLDGLVGPDQPLRAGEQ